MALGSTIRPNTVCLDWDLVPLLSWWTRGSQDTRLNCWLYCRGRVTSELFLHSYKSRRLNSFSSSLDEISRQRNPRRRPTFWTNLAWTLFHVSMWIFKYAFHKTDAYHMIGPTRIWYREICHSITLMPIRYKVVQCYGVQGTMYNGTMPIRYTLIFSVITKHHFALPNKTIRVKL